MITDPSSPDGPDTTFFHDDSSDIVTCGLENSESSTSPEETIMQLAPHLIAQHRVAALLKRRTGGFIRPDDWSWVESIRDELDRERQRMVPMLTEAIMVNLGVTLEIEGGEEQASEALARLREDVHFAYLRGHTDAWHARLTSWETFMTTVTSPDYWTHYDPDWSRELKTGYHELRKGHPIKSLTYNIVDVLGEDESSSSSDESIAETQPETSEKPRSPKTRFDWIIDTAPELSSLSLNLLASHLDELSEFLKAAHLVPQLRLSVEPSPQDSSSAQRTPILHKFDTLNPLRFAHLLDILRNCSRLVIFECASGEDLTPDVTECASDAKIKICLRDLIRFCVAILTPPRVNRLFDLFDFPALEETEFVICPTLINKHRDPLQLPHALKRWTEKADDLTIKLGHPNSEDQGRNKDEERSRLTVVYSYGHADRRTRHVLHGLWTHGKRTGKPNTVVKSTTWTPALIEDIPAFFPNIKKLSIDGVLPNRPGFVSILDHLQGLARTCTKNDLCMKLERLTLRHDARWATNQDNDQLDEKERCMTSQAMGFFRDRKAAPAPVLQLVATCNRTGQITTCPKEEEEEENPLTFQDYLSLFRDTFSQKHFDEDVHRFFDAACRWSLQDMADRLMYTVAEI
ncbi:hypothetical protein SISNIDRAFT_519069 [Sistotremastrum niveocremeum HHB9708]|uniref:Uncharacterized protein n=1 Tax=Sistotremastrum niveocremeum HHB9708 TaxID=1314777 RepID=A0A164RRS8_9AGAM|nr:hypothetical protein SISNIDRAFT_519069 [Sistotremastrum niveocremeum HHB9708]